ncbi:MAG TPA: cytochrome c oxidase assembly protein [Solirubrobacteraceae bacterium]|nr:cytochrome c oxidase assembly protein [Solirubrobacteraceae bacterium]
MSAPSVASLLVSHWTVTASVLVPSVACAVGYALAAHRAGGRWPLRRTVSFEAGIASVVLALQSGIDAYDDQLLSVHMVQHMLLLVVVPPLLLGGRPLILALRSLPPGARRSFARVVDALRPCTGPVLALVVFGAVVVLTHIPSFYDATLRHPALHDCEHALYLAGGLLMWSPLLDGDPAPRHRLNGLAKLIYLIVAMLPMALVGAYLNRHATLVYPAYGPRATALGVSAVNDQAQAGAIMWVLGDSIMVAVGLWAALGAMLAEERRQVARDARSAALSGGERRQAT